MDHEAKLGDNFSTSSFKMGGILHPKIDIVLFPLLKSKCKILLLYSYIKCFSNQNKKSLLMF
jgi:hypothetical protein